MTLDIAYIDKKELCKKIVRNEDLLSARDQGFGDALSPAQNETKPQSKGVHISIPVINEQD